MIELDGVEYSVNDAGTNAALMREAINAYASDNQIKNRKGELIQIEANWANPLYMILYGCGVLFNYVQQLVYSAGQAISITGASERQLLNIADMCNIKRKSATKTSIVATIFANLSGDDAVDCEITTDLVATVATSAGSVEFYPAYDVTIPIGESAKIILVTDTEGSFSIAENTITGFDVAPNGFRKMTTAASQPGQSQESIAELRARIQRRSVSGTVVDRCQDAISELTGVSSCNMYYNNSAVESVTVAGLTVLPRQALLFVQGYSDKIAETYWSYMLSECAGSESETAIVQYYETHGGQLLPVYIIPPEQVYVYVRVYLDNDLTSEEAQNFRDAIASLANSLVIGQGVSSASILKLLQKEYSSYAFTGVQVSLDGEEWSFKVTPGVYQLIIFNNDYIQIVGSSD